MSLYAPSKKGYFEPLLNCIFNGVTGLRPNISPAIISYFFFPLSFLLSFLYTPLVPQEMKTRGL